MAIADHVRSGNEWIKLILHSAHTGEILRLAPVLEGEHPDPGQADNWAPHCLLPAEHLRDALIAIAREKDKVDPQGLRIVGADIPTRLDLDGIELRAPLWLDYCRLQAGISMQGAKVEYLSFEGSEIKDGKFGEPAVNLIGVHVASNLFMAGTKLNAGGRNALFLDRATVGGDAYFNSSDTHGLVRAVGVNLTGELILKGARMKGAILNDTPIPLYRTACRVALVLDGSTIAGGANLNRVRITGEVRAVGAIVNGRLEMLGATLLNKGGESLSLHGAHIRGNAFLEEEHEQGIRHRFAASGLVSARSANVTGTLAMTGAILDGGLDLTGADIRRLLLAGLERVKGNMCLTDCHIDNLVLNKDGESPPGGTLLAEGWQVGSLTGAIASREDLAQCWLDTRSNNIPYSPQPARMIAGVYERSGHPDKARWLRYKAACQLTKQAPRWAKPGHYLYRVLVGHGYYPLRALGWLFVVFMITFLIVTSQKQAFTPTDPGKATAAVLAVQSTNSSNPPVPNGATSCRDLGTYPCFSPDFMALRTVVPAAAAVETTVWQPTSWVAIVLSVAKAFGWILSVLFLVGITGLLHRT